MARLRMGALLVILAWTLIPRANAPATDAGLHRLPSLADAVTRPTRLPSLADSVARPTRLPSLEEQPDPARQPGSDHDDSSSTFPPVPTRDHHPDRSMRRIPSVEDPVAGDPRFHRLPPENGFGVTDLNAYYRQQVGSMPPVTSYGHVPPATRPYPPSSSPFLYSNFQQPAEEGESSSAERQPIGPEPEESLNEQFLRQTTLLLKPGNWQYDVGFVYAWQE